MEIWSPLFRPDIFSLTLNLWYSSTLCIKVLWGSSASFKHSLLSHAKEQIRQLSLKKSNKNLVLVKLKAKENVSEDELHFLLIKARQSLILTCLDFSVFYLDALGGGQFLTHSRSLKEKNLQIYPVKILSLYFPNA